MNTLRQAKTVSLREAWTQHIKKSGQAHDSVRYYKAQPSCSRDKNTPGYSAHALVSSA